MENNLTIFNVYVELNNDYDLFLRLINACKEAGLKTDNLSKKEKEKYLFPFFHENDTCFFSDWCMYLSETTQVTEEKFIELLNEYKSQNK
jgi:hypothetical protein